MEQERMKRLRKKGTLRWGSAWLMLLVGIACLPAQETDESRDYQYALIEAVKQKNLGNFAEAVKLYRLVIQSKPDCDAAHYELGTIYLVSNQLEMAQTSLSRAFELDPSNQWYTLAYLNALAGTASYDRMHDILRMKIKEEPDNVEWEYQLANVYHGEGKYRKSIRVLDQIEKEHGFSEKITLLKASIYESEEEYDLAKREIEKVMTLFPEAVQFRVVAAELSMKSGDEEGAAAYYREILEIDSTNIFALTNLTDFYRKQGNDRRSIEYLTKSFRSPQIDVKRKLAIMSYYLSEERFREDYRPELEALMLVFLEEHPGEAEARLLATDFYIDGREYALAYRQLEQYLEGNTGGYPIYMQAVLLANAASLNRELIDMAGRALEAFPDSADFRFFRGIGFYELEEYAQLIDNFESISGGSFSSEEYAFQSRMLVAEAYYRLGEFAASDSLFEALIRDDPGNHTVLNNYSYYLAERGEKLEQAHAWSKEVILQNPDNATFLDTHAWVLFKMGAYEEAEAVILRALSKGGENDPEINEHAADIQVALSGYDLARSYYEKAILLGGDRQRIEEKLENLENLDHAINR